MRGTPNWLAARRPEIRAPGFGRVRWTLLLVVLLPIPVVLFLGPYVRDALNGASENDACPFPRVDIAGHAAYLLDLRKPLNPAQASLPGKLLRDISHDLDANTELKVFTLTPYAESPRMLLGRLCKPYDNADLTIATAKDQGNGSGFRDCNDIPAQVPASLRDKANRFCAQRNALQRRIDVMVQQHREGRVANAFLAEALEDTFQSLENLSGSKSLYLFSDMFQHSSWYSHLDLQWEDWAFEEFAETRDRQSVLIGAPAPVIPGLRVKVFYVPRTGSTENLRVRVAHQQFWQDYFADATLDFEDRAPMLELAHDPLMNVPSKAEIAAQERERVRFEREAVERLRARIKEEQLELESVRQRLTDETRELEARERELRQQQDQLAEEKNQFAARSETAGVEGN
ncbi:MAG: hypothetical protein OXP28_08310 [Gammaproteobacteria bacterium]|nr:hypothetical protein [Gammaproteobacteria bacterium]